MGWHGNRLHTESPLNGRAQLYGHPARSTSVDVPKTEDGLRLGNVSSAVRVVALCGLHDVRTRERKQDALSLDRRNELRKKLGHGASRRAAAMHLRKLDPLVLVQKDYVHEIESYPS